MVLLFLLQYAKLLPLLPHQVVVDPCLEALVQLLLKVW